MTSLTLVCKRLFRQRLHLVPGNGDIVRYSLGTRLNTLFFQVLTLEFRHNAGTREYYLRGSECNKIMGYGGSVCRFSVAHKNTVILSVVS